MSDERKVFCIKLQKELPGLARLPIQGELGQKVFDNVSKEAFKMFLEYFKMIVNEYRLDLSAPESDKIFEDQMNEYFFGKGANLPNQYTPVK